MRTRIYLLDEQPVYRAGLAAVLSELAAAEIVGGSADVDEAAPEIVRLAPDAALVSLEVPGLAPEALLSRLATEGVRTRVIFLVGASRDGHALYEIVARGAAGFLAKDAPPGEVAAAVTAALDGGMPMSPALARGLAAEVRRRSTAVSLTPREEDVLRLVAEGAGNAEIGRRLGVGTTTVKSHLEDVYRKLGVPDRAAAVASALRHGLID